jgi:hypothetical protein
MALRHSRHHAGPEQMQTGGITAEARTVAGFAESRTVSTMAESVTSVLKAEFWTIAFKAESEKPSWQNLRVLPSQNPGHLPPWKSMGTASVMAEA